MNITTPKITGICVEKMISKWLDIDAPLAHRNCAMTYLRTVAKSLGFDENCVSLEHRTAMMLMFLNDLT